MTSITTWTTLTTRQGMGRKDRVIPIGERALAWINKNLEESRDQPILRREKKEASARVSRLAAAAQLGLVKIEADNLSGPADKCRDGSGPIRIDQDPGLLGGAL